MWLHFAPVDDRIVVSETGEQWSPHTAPAMTADRQGSNNQSRTSMGKDSAGEMQIRKNNSYLHDNVD